MAWRDSKARLLGLNDAVGVAPLVAHRPERVGACGVHGLQEQAAHRRLKLVAKNDRWAPCSAYLGGRAVTRGTRRASGAEVG